MLPGDANTLRREPSTSAERLDSIPGSATFLVVEGPVCAEGYVWWRVEYGPWVGWTADGAGGEFWLEPVQQQASTIPITAENAAQVSVLQVLRCGDISGGNGTAALGPDEDLVAFGCGADSGAGEASWPIGVMDLASGEIIHMLTGHGNATASILFLPPPENTPDLYRLLTNGNNSYGRATTYIWNLETGEELASADPFSAGNVLLLPDESALTFRDGSGVLLLDAVDLEPVSQFTTAGLTFAQDESFELTRGLAIRPGNNDKPSLLAAMDGYGDIAVWDLDTGDVIYTLTQGNIRDMAQQRVALTFSPNGNFLISGICTANGEYTECLAAEIAWWSMRDGTRAETWNLDLHDTFNSGPSSLVFTPDASLLAVGTCDTVALFDVATGKLAAMMPAEAEALTFSADGSYFLGACQRTVMYGLPTTTDSAE